MEQDNNTDQDDLQKPTDDGYGPLILPPDFCLREADKASDANSGFHYEQMDNSQNSKATETAQVKNEIVPTKAKDDPNGHDSAATFLVKHAVKYVSSWIIASNGTRYAVMKLGNGKLVLALDSEDFREWLRDEYWEAREGVILDGSLNATVAQLQAHAKKRGIRDKVYVRVAGLPGLVYIDLADGTGRAIEVSKSGWQLVDSCPVHFVTSPGMLPLVEPQHGGSIDLAKQYAPLPDKEFVMLISFIVSAFSPTGPYPILAITGQHGSMKSSIIRLVRDLTDPNDAQLKGYPRSVDEVVISAMRNRVIVYDNLTALSDEMSDLFAGMSTGMAHSKRKLYSDTGEIVITVQNPIILGSINDVVARPDLISRSVFVGAPKVEDDEYESLRDLAPRLQGDLPLILGAILEGVVSALQHIGDKHRSIGRMKDFTDWISSAEVGLGWSPGTFESAYTANKMRTTRVSTAKSAVIEAVCKAMEDVDEMKDTPSALQEKLTSLSTSAEFPQSVQAFGTILAGAADDLRVHGISIKPESIGSGKDKRRGWHIWKPDEQKPADAEGGSPGSLGSANFETSDIVPNDTSSISSSSTSTTDDARLTDCDVLTTIDTDSINSQIQDRN